MCQEPWERLKGLGAARQGEREAGKAELGVTQGATTAAAKLLDCEVTLDGQVFSAQFEERPCWDETKVCAAAFVSSAKTTCVHPDRQDPYLCGDCPRNPKSAFEGEKVCAAAAFVSSAKSQCVHPERKDPYLCGDCPRNGAKAFAFVSAKSQCVHPERKDPYLCGDCPRNSVV
ncbi:unnamed protein product [Effrenium voratum]|nr:unnamed protein product [Effrenium voratum]